MQFRNTLGPCVLELVGWQIAHHHSVHGVRGSEEGENMLGVNSLHELTGHELKRTARMTHDNMADHN